MSGNDCDLEIDGSNDSEVMREGGCSDVARSSRDVRCSRTNSDNVAGVTTIEEERKKGRREEGDLSSRVGCRGEREMAVSREGSSVGRKGDDIGYDKGEREMEVAKEGSSMGRKGDGSGKRRR
ncbi:hypothetical protein BHE74_00039939 [Ensete ventricosum]|nr:hypothetical protein BHE74_00039939 [Ensete ventricosum]